MLRKVNTGGWLLEVSDPRPAEPAAPYTAWVSNPRRLIVGYGRGFSPGDAARRALIDAGHHYATDPDALADLETAYFGATGMLATAACAASGQ